MHNDRILSYLALTVWETTQPAACRYYTVTKEFCDLIGVTNILVSSTKLSTVTRWCSLSLCMLKKLLAH